MKIAIDVSSVVYGTGVSVYTKNLVNNLVKVDKNNNYLLFGGSLRQFNKLKNSFNDIDNKYYRMPPLLMNYLFNRTNLPVNLFTGKIDIFHASDWTQPTANCPVVTTVHDLSPLKFSQFTSLKIVKTHKVRLQRAKKMASKIIAVSESTKNDLIQMGFNKNKIVVIYEAADKLPAINRAQESEALKKYDLENVNFILNIGTNPRKNNTKIASAFRALHRKGIIEKFAVTGTKPDNPDPNINYLGYVSDEELAALYQNAACLVYASLYEGFGIPVLQAFEDNCPVVTSKVSSLPEVAGNAAILVDPEEPEDIAAGVVMAIKEKKNLTKNGHLQAQKFSWQKCARETMGVYNSLQ